LWLNEKHQSFFSGQTGRFVGRPVGLKPETRHLIPLADLAYGKDGYLCPGLEHHVLDTK
jgi:hypothetical protein